MSIVLSFILIGYAFFLSLGADTKDYSKYINMPGLYLVVIGLLALIIFTMKSFVMRSLWAGLKIAFLPNSAKKWKEEVEKTINALDEGSVYESKNKLIARFYGLYQLGLTQEELKDLYEKEALSFIIKLEDGAYYLKNLTKYPPALGMMGTVIGMVGVFSQLNLEEAQNQIGLNLALAMTSTLYGLIISNFIISPLSEKLMAQLDQTERMIKMTMDAFLDLKKDKGRTYIKEKMETYRVAL